MSGHSGHSGNAEAAAQSLPAMKRALHAAARAVPGVAMITYPSPLARILEGGTEPDPEETVWVGEDGCRIAIAVTMGFNAAEVGQQVRAALQQAWRERADVAGVRRELGPTQVRIVAVLPAPAPSK